MNFREHWNVILRSLSAPNSFTLITKRTSLGLAIIAIFGAVIAGPAAAQISYGDKATTASYNSGNIIYFGRIDYVSPGKWVETTKDKSYQYNYVETGRDPNSVFLYDSSRNVRLQLDFKRKMIAASFNDATYVDYIKISSSASLSKGRRPRPLITRNIVKAPGTRAVQPRQGVVRKTNAGPIYNQQDAQLKCPVAAYAVGGTWTNQWSQTGNPNMAVCDVMVRP